jgi:hypothetical protein
MLSKVNAVIRLMIRVIFNDIEQIYYHLGLRPMKIMCLVVLRDIVRLIIGKIRIHPDSHFASGADEYHLFADVEVSYFLIQHLESLKS